MENDNGKKATKVAKQRILRCLDWFLKQSGQEPKRNVNLNDIDFIVETNTDRRKFMLSSVDDETSVPAGVDEVEVKPVAVPVHKLCKEGLRLECEWKSCDMVTTNYDLFQKHVISHTRDVHVIVLDEKNEFMCLWDVCKFQTDDFDEMVRHINYHAYHSKLLAIGFNARATLNLPRCNKDSTKRNKLPALKTDFQCLWVDCGNKFKSVQFFINHVKSHVNSADSLTCTWAGCGATFPRRSVLSLHVRRHTGERMIACYHCGQHYATNTKLADHLHRQGSVTDTSLVCKVCGAYLPNARLLRQHSQQHVSVHACSLCDMTAPTRSALASHIRYRHLGHDISLRKYLCPHCDYRAITNSDLKKHIPIHTKKRKTKRTTDEESSDEECHLIAKKEKKVQRKYCCHMCPKNKQKVFLRGNRLTAHLVNVHGAQRSCSRFKYQICDDGMYRLNTTRYESLEVSKKVTYGDRGPIGSLNKKYDVEIFVKSEVTEFRPMQLGVKLNEAGGKDGEEIFLKQEEDGEQDMKKIEAFKKEEINSLNGEVEITMCDVDEDGNIIHSTVVTSDVQYL